MDFSAKSEIRSSLYIKHEICEPKTKVGFMKTHKTGSSTIQNILLRYAEMYELNIMLPNKGNRLNYYKNGLHQPFQMRWLKHVPWHQQLASTQGYDMTLLHTKWNHEVFREALGQKAVFVTILRDPSDTFESLYSYFKLQNYYKMELPKFIQRLDQDPSLSDKRFHGYLGLNMQIFEFGFNLNDRNNKTAIDKKIKEIESNFDLVMIMEKLPESLVLLADSLCLPLFMMASLKLNERKPYLKVGLSETEKSILRKHQSADEILYEHFKLRLEKQIEDFGVERMRQ